MEKRYTIDKLPSGFWCVWFGPDWISASFATREAAESFIETLTK